MMHTKAIDRFHKIYSLPREPHNGDGFFDGTAASFPDNDAVKHESVILQ
jgi:hypothetical protein